MQLMHPWNKTDRNGIYANKTLKSGVVNLQAVVQMWIQLSIPLDQAEYFGGEKKQHSLYMYRKMGCSLVF